VPPEHAHLVHVDERRLLCACRACAVLFTQPGAARGSYRAIPDRYRHDPAHELNAAQWDALQVPVGLAFFFLNSRLGHVVAHYPGPAGATESLLDLSAWEGLAAQVPLAAALDPDVEALLVRRVDGGFESYLVPIDACYELVGRLRLAWSGFDGGPEAAEVMTAFFTALRSRSRPLEHADA
jgi:hypothetical protein